MRTLVLSAPDLSALDVERLHDAPPALWPVGSQSLVAHWLDHALRMGFRRVRLHAPDRPAALRAALGQGEFWSLELEIDSSPAPADAAVMLQLPLEDPAPAPDSRAAVIRWWIDLNRRWLDRRDPGVLSLDREVRPGIWVGPQAEIDPTAVLHRPCWIGSGARVGPGCTVGPGALIGAGAVIERDVVLSHAVVEPRTHVGANLELCAKIVSGTRALDVWTGAISPVVDRFLLAPLDATRTRVKMSDRLAAALLWLPAQLLALAAGPARTEICPLPDGRRLELTTRARGPLLAQRAGWLRHVVAGRLHLVGIPPQPPVADLPGESLALLRAAPVGVFGLGDVRAAGENGADAAAHALYLAAVPAGEMDVRRQLPRLMFRSCPSR